jgi:hypothetical protein
VVGTSRPEEAKQNHCRSDQEVPHTHTHKFGIKVPKIWDEAVKLDEENGKTLWQDAIRKYMNNIRIAFKVLNGEEAIPPTYQEIRCHMIFDMKM